MSGPIVDVFVDGDEIALFIAALNDRKKKILEDKSLDQGEFTGELALIDGTIARCETWARMEESLR